MAEQEAQGESSSLTQLNKLAKNGYIQFDSLEVGVPYKIIKFGKLTTDKYKQGHTHLIAFIEDGYLILPERFDGMTDSIDEINIEKIHIIFNGRENKRLNIEFIEK